MNPMATAPPPGPDDRLLYPDSDGMPMSDDTLQHRWIALLFDNVNALFADRADVYVAADLLWYAVEGHPEERMAPDVMVAFVRPKGYRGSYRQWQEGDVPVTVAFEVLSPSNSRDEMARKGTFYAEHGVEEYYVYDPDADTLEVYFRSGSAPLRQRQPDGFVSPRLGIRFDLSGEEMVVYRPNGERFRDYLEVETSERLALMRQGQADEARRQAEQRAARLAELGRKVRRGQATPEEVAELERLEAECLPPA